MAKRSSKIDVNKGRTKSHKPSAVQSSEDRVKQSYYKTKDFYHKGGLEQKDK